MPFRPLTWLASGLLLLVFTGITGLVWHEREQELQVQLDQDAAKLQTAFQVAVSNLEQQMLALASLLAADPEVQQRFDQGRKILETEGGGPGGERTAQARAALLDRVKTQWNYMQQQFGVRQLQFHLGPGVLSFLRVHAPERFGDRMDGLRHIIQDTNLDHRPRSGFETGRVQSGVRGVVPVRIANPDGTRRYVGALEAGAAFDTQLEQLDRQLGVSFAVLLKPEHVEAATWREYRKNQPVDHPLDAYLEAGSRPEMANWLGSRSLPNYQDQALSWLDSEGQQTWHFLRFPLRDYLSQTNPKRPPVGSVLAWRDVSQQMARHRQARWKLAGQALAGYLTAQLLLLWLLRVTQRQWSQRLEAKAEQLRASEARIQPLLMGLGEGVYGVDMAGRATFINPAALRMLGLTAEQALGRDQHQLFHHHYQDGAPYSPTVCPVSLTLADGLSRRAEDEWFWRADGSGFPVAMTITPVVENHARAGAVVIFQDISERQAHARELQRLASTDPLTGVANRRHFLEQVEAELARHQRYGEAGALLMLDLDHFKQVNDTYGHGAGDAVLKAFSELAQDSLRRSDRIGRLGGEEFAILLPDTGAHGAHEFAERLRQRVEENPVDTSAGHVLYRVSIGIALLSRSDTTADSLLARADNALYRAKHLGRNRVEIENNVEENARPGNG